MASPPDTQLGLTNDEIALLRHHQQAAASTAGGSSSRAASRAKITLPAKEGEPGNQSTIQAHSTISKDETGGMEAVERKLLMILASKYFPVWR
jgi:hypothetical protein